MRDPKLVVDFYNARRQQASEVEPNAAHRALAELERQHDGEVVVITQNVDDLHERGGTQKLYHMHGALKSALCAACDHRWPAPMVMAPGDPCPSCEAATARPDIVWFGEMPYEMDTLFHHLGEADLFAAIGTSGNVYPAAGFVAEARRAGAHTIEFNLERTGGPFIEHRIGPASKTVTDWVAEVLAG